MAWDPAWANQLPVDDFVSADLVQVLGGSDFTLDLLRQIPIDGPWSPGELRRLAEVGFEATADFARSLPIDEPLTSSAVLEFAAIGYERSREAVRTAQASVQGPLSLHEALQAARMA